MAWNCVDRCGVRPGRPGRNGKALVGGVTATGIDVSFCGMALVAATGYPPGDVHRPRESFHHSSADEKPGSYISSHGPRQFRASDSLVTRSQDHPHDEPADNVDA